MEFDSLGSLLDHETVVYPVRIYIVAGDLSARIHIDGCGALDAASARARNADFIECPVGSSHVAVQHAGRVIIDTRDCPPWTDVIS